MRLLFSIALIVLLSGFCQAQSVLSAGNWYKFKIEERGIYKLTYSTLSSLGIDVNAIDPETIQVYGKRGGTLPQALDATTELGLEEFTISVSGASDGSFDSGDAIYFYAEGPDAEQFTPNGLDYEQNIYDRANYCFLTYNQNPGKRVEVVESPSGAEESFSVYDDYLHYEFNRNNLLKSGRKWYGERFELTTNYNFDFNIPGLVDNSELSITSKVMAQSFAASDFEIQVNGVTVGTQDVPPVPDFRVPAFRYSIKGREKMDEFITSSGTSDNVAITYTYNRNNSGRSTGFLDYFNLEFKRALRLYDSQTSFRVVESTNHSVSEYIIESDRPVRVWDITSALDPAEISVTSGSNSNTFLANSEELHEYVAFDPAEVPTPELVEQVSNQNLSGIPVPELLIISPEGFMPEAQRLAQYRNSMGISATAVNVNLIYNEFSSGRQDVSAIRNFIKSTFDRGNQLKYVLLFGRGSFDYLDILNNNTNFIPTYQSRNSLHPLYTFASDDYFGFMEDTEGAWLEENGGNHSMELGVGRLPIKSLQEAKILVDKIIDYESNPIGKWKRDIVFVADDGDGNLHNRQADDLTKIMEENFSSFSPQKVYLDDFQQESRPNGEVSPAATAAINKYIDQGSLIVNFTGHGGETGWMQEQVLDLVNIESWRNDYLPLFVTATCQFSRHDDPAFISGGERVLLNKQGGGIAIVSTSRPVFASSNFELNKALIDAAFQKENGRHARLGDILRITKNNSIDLANDINRVGNRNFTLLGDPSLQLNYPEHEVAITEVLQNGESADTLNAQGSIHLSGLVQSLNQQQLTNFNGTIEVTLFDKKTTFKTLGNENAPFEYEKNENALFRGTASVVNGAFEIEFIMPKNMGYQFGEGKLIMYAWSDDNSTDAAGAAGDLVLGGSTLPVTDTEGPEINVFFGDSTSLRRDNVNTDTNIAIKLNDESGINISTYGIDNNIVAVIDDTLRFVLNEAYIANQDDFKEGWVNFRVTDLAAGTHTLSVKAWDTQNNVGEYNTTFDVLAEGSLSLTTAYNYPNPFTDQTTFVFRHNRAGEDLEVNLSIWGATGVQIREMNYIVNNAPSSVELAPWDGTDSTGNKLEGGLYYFRLKTRSLSDGAMNTVSGRTYLLK